MACDLARRGIAHRIIEREPGPNRARLSVYRVDGAERRFDEWSPASLPRPSRPRRTSLAAHWQSADSSHFSRAFKKRYGPTPTKYTRSITTPPRR